MIKRTTILSRLRAPLLGSAVMLSAIVFAAGAQAGTCEDLAKFPLKGGKITAAISVAQNAGIELAMYHLSIPAPVKFCRVSATLTPTSDSAIMAEVWLPEPANWNGKFLGSGNGGFGGSLTGPELDMRIALGRGYATAGNDLGHETPTPAIDASWALKHPEKVKDFAYRADHVTADFAKAVIAAYYGHEPKLSYFKGCSNGGHEALMEAQRFPQDYDGIIAGAPANSWTHLMATFLWNETALNATPQSGLPMTKLVTIQNAVLAKCDELDGVKDGVVNDPPACHFDPKVLLCKSGDGPNCLTQAQVTTLNKIVQGPVDPKTGQSIYPGFPLTGAEGIPHNWDEWITNPKSNQSQFANQFYGTIVMGDPNWDYHNFDFAKDMASTDAGIGTIINSNNPDLSAFAAHGGKLILFQGWADAAVTPLGTLQYYQNIEAKMGGASTANFARLFMAPGMMHCFGGPGPGSLDTVTALENWREKGVAPDSVTASRYANPLLALAGLPAGDPLSVRPVCAYPNIAHWTGTGSADEAKNYVCRAPGK